MKTDTSALWEFRSLGGIELSLDGAVIRPERKTAALLTFLAIESRGARHTLAGMLWPESTEESARANLRQLLRRLRLSTGDELVEGQDTLHLSARVRSDVRAALQASASTGWSEVLQHPGELLPDLNFDDCEELSQWLSRSRERLTGLRHRAYASEVERRVQAGDFRGARERIDQWIALDPLAEEPWRERLRVLHASGDRAAALAAFERLRELLERELGVEPDAETVALVRRIERDQLPRRAPSSSALPLNVLRPPVLAGRERAWQQLEEGWEARQFLVVTGEPGMGKSRLARDFAASRGRYTFLEGRPGDRAVPFASQVRAMRQLRRDTPSLEIPEWARRELTRILPELLQPGEEPPPLTSGADKIRFLDAQTEIIVRATQGNACVVIDDVQYFDAASVEAAEYALSQHFPFGQPGGLPRFVDCVRKGEIPESSQKVIDGLRSAGFLRLVELEPLSNEGVARLLNGLELPGSAELSADIARYTGGNPLFVVETVKHLLETGGLERGWPGSFPPPGKVAALVQRRIQRLSPLALQLIQLAALAGTNYDIPLAAQALEVSQLSAAAAHAEAEAALILRDRGFAHDLLHEAVRASIPAPLKAALHRRLAVTLEAVRAPAIHIAQHWLDAGEAMRAVPLLIQAARVEEAALQFADAAAHYAQAEEVLSVLGSPEEAARMRDEHERCRALKGSGLDRHQAGRK